MNNKSYDFVSAQLDYWDSPWQNRHGFLWELSKNNRVFFMSPPFYLVDLIRNRGSGKTKLQGLSMIKPNLYNYVPPRYLPYNYRFEWLDKFIKKARERIIKDTLQRLKFDRPVLIVWHPRYADMIGKFNESVVVYYKYDNYSGYVGGSGKVGPGEIKLMKKANMVLVTSQGLYDLHKDDCKEIHVVPNGVDYEYYVRSLTDEVVVPPDMAAIPKPRIGYIGVINEKVDFRLLTYLCKARPNWSIVLVGPVRVVLPEYKEHLGELREQKNCYFLGQKENKHVPSYIKGLDVCLMCYLVNEWTHYGYPLKMHEYLACGKPSVSADLPEVRPYCNVVRIAHSYDQWHDSIERELNQADSDNIDNITIRLKVAESNSWKERVNQVVTLIDRKSEIQNPGA